MLRLHPGAVAGPRAGCHSRIQQGPAPGIHPDLNPDLVLRQLRPAAIFLALAIPLDRVVLVHLRQAEEHEEHHQEAYGGGGFLTAGLSSVSFISVIGDHGGGGGAGGVSKCRTQKILACSASVMDLAM